MSNFHIWCADVNNTQAYNDFVKDTQRQNGFQAGTPASSLRVNTALRQANLVACALMDMLDINGSNVNFRSSIADVEAVMTSGLYNIIRTTKVDKAYSADSANNTKKLDNVPISASQTGLTLNNYSSTVNFKVLWTGSKIFEGDNTSYNDYITIASGSISENDILLVDTTFSLNGTTRHVRFIVRVATLASSISSNLNNNCASDDVAMYNPSGSGSKMVTCALDVQVTSSKLWCRGLAYIQGLSTVSSVTITKITKLYC